MVKIRPEKPADFQSVYKINEAAFKQPDEARLVDAVRLVANPLLSLIAERDGIVVGYVFFTPVTVLDEDVTWQAMGLGPVAVLPKFQNQGIGSMLIESGLEACRSINQQIVFVLGHQAYYPRFGFLPAAKQGLHFSNPDLDPYFFVKELAPAALAGRKGYVHYLSAFDEI